MREIYQKSWQGIKFSDINTLDSRELPGVGFYSKFYSELFKKYNKPDELSLEWLSEKSQIAGFINKLIHKHYSVLSIGSGLGIIEGKIVQTHPSCNLYIQERSDVPWLWLENNIPEKNRLIGIIPECLPDYQKYNIIYLCAVDYSIETTALIALLQQLRFYLSPGGTCFIFSASFNDHRNPFLSVGRYVKDWIHSWLQENKLYSRGQFWGWSRSSKEYHDIMVKAGYNNISDGYVDSVFNKNYWIKGS